MYAPCISSVITPFDVQFECSFRFVDFRLLDSGDIKYKIEQMDNKSSANEIYMKFSKEKRELSLYIYLIAP